jgi:histidinol dehydrogenase
LDARLLCVQERNVALDPELLREVSEIINQVRLRGDAALVDYANRFDQHVMTAAQIRIPESALHESAARADADVSEAIAEAIKRVRAFHEHEREGSWQVDGPNGVRLGQRIVAIERAGLYVPGGTASYPSSVVMNVVPAQIAGVDRIVVVTPPRTIQENPSLAAALVKLNITEVYGCGGAQAVAALAFGTETVPRVDKITGPGNRYVAAAKKLVFGTVGIDSIAGPSEVIVIADDSARASFVASDLLAQAEHAPDAAAILITTSEALALAVRSELETQLRTLSRASVIATSFERYGAIFVAQDLDEACALVNKLAPEHLQIMAHNEEEIASRIRNAGAIFLGEYSPEVVGDYLAGPNHVLPTSGTARFASALSVRDFTKRSSILKFSAEELKKTAALIAVLARAEGLEAHARSALMRLN